MTAEKSTEFANKYARSAQIVNKYYRRLLSHVADDVLQSETDFENPFLGQAETFFEKNARLLHEVTTVYAHLKRSASSERTIYRVKVFDVCPEKAEAVINDWLEDHAGCEVLSLTSSNDSCVVLYREGGCGP